MIRKDDMRTAAAGGERDEGPTPGRLAIALAEGEAVTIGPDIRVEMIRLGKTKVRVCVVAPKTLPIHRDGIGPAPKRQPGGITAEVEDRIAAGPYAAAS